MISLVYFLPFAPTYLKGKNYILANTNASSGKTEGGLGNRTQSSHTAEHSFALTALWTQMKRAQHGAFGILINTHIYQVRKDCKKSIVLWKSRNIMVTFWGSNLKYCEL